MKRFGPAKRRRRRPPDPSFKKFMSDDEREEAELAARKAISLADADFPLRNVNSFEERGIYTLGDLAQKTRDELLEIANVGEKTLVEAAKRLDHYGVDHPAWTPATRPRRK